MQPSQRGFTLIELGVVLAVLSVMAAAVVPNFIETTRNQLAERTVEQILHVQDAAKWYFITSDGDPDERRWPGQRDAGRCSARNGLAELHGSGKLSRALSANPWKHPYELSVSGAPASCSFVTSTLVPDGVALMTAELLPGGACEGCPGGRAPAGWTRCCSTIPRPGFEASLAGLHDQLLEELRAQMPAGSGGSGYVPPPDPVCTRGYFCNEVNREVEWMCDCGGAPGMQGWVAVGGWCFHRLTGSGC